MLEEDGQPVATVTWDPDFGDDASEVVRWAYPHVRRDRRGERLDARLLRHALALDPGPVREVRTTLHTDFVEATSFLGIENFEELYRSWGSHLDLTCFDPGRFDGVVEEFRREGFRLARYFDLAPDAELEARVIAFQRRVEEDAVAFEPVIPRRHDDLHSPDPGRRQVRYFEKQARSDPARGVLAIETKRVLSDGTERLAGINLKFTPCDRLRSLVEKAGFEFVGEYGRWRRGPLEPMGANVVLNVKRRSSLSCCRFRPHRIA